MKFFSITVAAAAVATKPTFQLGEKIGEALSGEISSGTASTDFQPMSMVNEAVARAVAAENKKFSSFLTSQNQRPLLNLHVAETHEHSMAAENAGLDRAMSALESDEVARLEKLARRSSFVQGDIHREGVEFMAAKSASDYYTSLLDLGGPAARKGVVGLLKLASLPNAKAVMTFSSVLSKTARFAKRESTTDADRDLAGSLITFLTNMPVAFQASDSSTGAYGHTNLVVPAPSRVYGADQVLAELAAGARAEDTSAGAYYA